MDTRIRVMAAILIVMIVGGAYTLFNYSPTTTKVTITKAPTPITTVVERPTVPYPSGTITQVVELPPIGFENREPLATPATPRQNESRMTALFMPQPTKGGVTTTFSLRSVDDEKEVTFKSLEKIDGQYRPWEYDEAHGAEIKVVLNKPAKDFLVVSDDGRHTLEFLTPWSTGSDGHININEVSGNTYFFNADRHIWVYPRKGTSLESLSGRDEEKEKVGQQIYGPWMLGSYSSSSKQLLIAKDLKLEPTQEFASVKSFEKFVSDENSIGLLMTEGDAKRFAYYNGQPTGRVEGSFFGWSIPNKDNQPKGFSKYTHLGLAYNSNVGYDTPIRYGGLVFVNIMHDPNYYPHGTLIVNGQQGGWTK